MSFYVLLGSEDSLNFFPQNNPYQFRSQLSSPLQLSGLWKVAIVETDISTSFSRTDSIYIHSNICDNSLVHGQSVPLLRRLMFTEPGNWSTILAEPHYIPVKNSDIYDIDIFITDGNDNLTSFLDQPSTVTLHFRAFPFL